MPDENVPNVHFLRASGSNAEDTEVRTGWSMLARSALTAKRQSEVFTVTNLRSTVSAMRKHHICFTIFIVLARSEINKHV